MPFHVAGSVYGILIEGDVLRVGCPYRDREGEGGHCICLQSYIMPENPNQNTVLKFLYSSHVCMYLCDFIA